MTENPIRENGQWLGGGTDAIKWTDVRTVNGKAWGQQVGASYTDATAILTGAWSANQYAEGTVYITVQGSPICHQEVELRLRSALSPNVNRGYEVYWQTGRWTSNSYIAVSRWHGPQGQYRRLIKVFGIKYGIVHGDVVRAEIVGNTIRAYKNGVLQVQVTDSMWTDGAPGMGFNLEASKLGCAGTNANFGFSSFRAGSM